MKVRWTFSLWALLMLPFFVSCRSNSEDSQYRSDVNTSETEQVDSPTEPSEPSLQRTLWESIFILGYEAEIPEDYNPSIALVEERVSGTTGCNKYSGSYILDGDNHLQFSPLATTKMACLNELGELESSFTKAMEQVHSYEIADRQLKLFNEQGEQVIVLKYVQDLNF